MATHPRVCIVVGFKQRYDSNIPKLRQIYQERFPLMKFLVPFYDGDDPDVIPVSASSEQGYYTQVLTALAPLGATHYLFLNDDLLLNPVVSAANLADLLGLGPEDGFFPILKSVCETDSRWTPMFSSFTAFMPTPRVPISDALPSREQAERLFADHGLPVRPLRWNQLLRVHRLTPKDVGAYLRVALPVLGRLLRDRSLPYPVAYGYSDMCVVPGAHLADFCRYCGVFTALGLFVEIAIPTALALACAKVVQMDAKGWSYQAIEELELRERFELEHRYSVHILLDHFPEHTIFIHPVKLTRWYTIENVG